MSNRYLKLHIRSCSSHSLSVLVSDNSILLTHWRAAGSVFSVPSVLSTHLLCQKILLVLTLALYPRDSSRLKLFCDFLSTKNKNKTVSSSYQCHLKPLANKRPGNSSSCVDLELFYSKTVRLFRKELFSACLVHPHLSILFLLPVFLVSVLECHPSGMAWPLLFWNQNNYRAHSAAVQRRGDSSSWEYLRC